MSVIQCEMKLCGLRPLLTAVKSRWTIPLKPGIEPTAQESEIVVFTRARSVRRPYDQVKRTYYLGEFHRC
jgi:hypothetical protein